MAMEENRAFAREFLYRIIDDTQGTIRSLDAKAGIGIFVLGAMVSKLLEPNVFSAIKANGAFGISVFALFAIFVVVSSVLVFRVVFPMVNPAQNVEVPDGLRPPFFIAQLQPSHRWRLFSSNPRFARLAETYSEYSVSIQNASRL